MPNSERQQKILAILQTLDGLEGLKRLFWQELNYERENKPISPRHWPESLKEALAEDPVLFASGGEEKAFHVVYCRLASSDFKRGLQRLVVNQLLRDHPYALSVFSNKNQSIWHFLNVKFDERAEKRRLTRRITVRPGDGLRTAVERMALLDLQAISPDLFGLSPLLIQQHHDVAFDVEKVTKDFYEEIANWYFWARDCPGVFFPKDVENEEQRALFLIRLLTRLIFCWFLREKRNPQTGAGLIPDSLFDARRVKDLLKDPSPEACTYYTAILQNLFFATLNTEIDRPGQQPERRFIDEGDGQRSDEHMVHQLWRHARQLRDPSVLEKLLRDIPFLNGGLFDCLDDRVQKGNSPYPVEVRVDGFATDPKKQPKLPNFLFYGAPQTVDLVDAYGDSSRRRETVRPLLDILNRYNFTLTENTPFDQEVALDPELLGHVFENLLAAYNPETGTVARKATGSFYTPRVVVDWMVDQALLVYLGAVLSDGGPRSVVARNKTDATERVPPKDSRLKSLLSWEEDDHEFTPAEVEKLIDVIDDLKAIDPACGSGAFPMGLLQKLVHVLKKLDPENKGWRKRQEKAAESIESGPAREEALKAIKHAFARDNDDYGRKLYLIENCLYGVDIQPIAVQIAKLRFFISLVVDQAIDPKEENYGILPLPNLETKVVAANTLLGLHRGQLLLGSNEVKRLEGELQKVRHDYFTARSYKRKKELRKDDKRLCDDLAKALEASGECTPYDAKRLADWNPYDTNTHAPFFDPGWMFGLTGGGSASTPTGRGETRPSTDGGPFDIVIGNPPYVRQEELKNQTVIGSDGKSQPLKDALQDRYESFIGTADLYVYFIERSLQLLRTGGALSFVTSNKYFRAAYGEKVRTYLRWATKPAVVLDFGDAPVFTSIAYPAILVTQKTRHVDHGKLPSAQGPMGILHPSNQPPDDWQSRVMTWAPGPDIREFPDIFDRDAFALAQSDLKPDGWRIENPISLRLLERLRKAGTPLLKYVNGNFFYGIKTGLGEAFVVTREERDALVREHTSSMDLLKPFLMGRDVKRWHVRFSDRYLVLIESSENRIHSWSGKSPRVAEAVFAKKYPAIHAKFDRLRKKLIGRSDQGHYYWELRSCAYWAEFEKPKVIFGRFMDRPTYAYDDEGIYHNDALYFASRVTPFVAAVTNSVINWWYLTQTCTDLQNGFIQGLRQYQEEIPIPKVSLSQQFLCERLAEALIWLHSPQQGGTGIPACASQAPQPGMSVSLFLEQWLNGLVYELFFPGELHARKLKLFDETAKLNPPDLAKLRTVDKLAALQELHEKAGKCIVAMLQDLSKVEEIRLIEEGL